jgi:hypothetical protein
VRSEIEERVDRLLHDAEHKESGAVFCETLVREPDRAREFRAERDALIAEAERLDPGHTTRAWKDATGLGSSPAVRPAPTEEAND